jgi:predicted house-cleaning noncanonical NTP pyrophosphatase (MazG superfamily)
MSETKYDSYSNPLLRKYIHDIRNSKHLNIKILEEINSFSYEDRLEILKIYSEIIKYYAETIELLNG